MALLRYTGQIDTNFHDVPYEAKVGDVVEYRLWRIGDVASGAEFSVPDEVAERFTRRDDVELVDGPDEEDETPEPVTAEDASAEFETDAAPVADATAE